MESRVLCGGSYWCKGDSSPPGTPVRFGGRLQREHQLYMQGNANISEPPNDIPDSVQTPQTDMENLVSLQNKKVQLAEERDTLALKKSELLLSIDRISTTLTHYKDQQLQYNAKQELEFYLHQNSHEFNKLTRPDQNASFVLDNLDVLPSRDPVQRLDLIGKFYPQFQIRNQSIRSVVEDRTPYNKIIYTVCSENLPPLQIELLSREEKLHSVAIVNLDDVSQLLHKISSSYAKALQTRYTFDRRIDLIMYSYHSLAQLQAKRVVTFAALLQQYQARVLRPKQSWRQNPAKSLMCLDRIELSFVEKKTGNTFCVQLRWDLVLTSQVTGEVESVLEFLIMKNDSGFLQKTNPVFITLAATHGVEKAFHILVANLFDYGSA